jgi:hypothetical protein
MPTRTSTIGQHGNLEVITALTTLGLAQVADQSAPARAILRSLLCGTVVRAADLLGSGIRVESYKPWLS